MKKWLLVLAVLFVVVISAVYLFTPSTLVVSVRKTADCNIAAANRYLQVAGNWAKWWPGRQISASADKAPYGVFEYREAVYSIDRLLYNGLDVSVVYKNNTYKGSVNLLPVTKDSVIIQFHLSRKNSLNPFSRFTSYSQSMELEKNMQVVQDSLRAFLHDKTKVYGIGFQRILNGERALMVIDSTFKYKPGNEEINGYIRKLRRAISNLGATEIGHPMLHISTADSLKYFMMVAVQTNIKLELEGKMYYKHTYPGYVLVTQVTGGQPTIDNTIKQLDTYIRDYEIVSPAIPYAEMITDRSKEPDSSKWVSRIYYPVF